MKTIKSFSYAIIISAFLFACKKDKSTPTPQNPPPPANEEEVITTVKLLFTDSASNLVTTFAFEDADGDGGNAGAFLGTNQSDSVITLQANKTYSLQILFIDVTKNPDDTISKEVLAEGAEHMIFFNATNPTGDPYQLSLAGSGISIKYLDTDGGTPSRGVGLRTRVRTYATTGGNKYPFKVTLKHQPGTKDGTFAPGDTDVEIPFKIVVN